jgi:CTP-dependent riboflavin kinase
MVSVKGRIQGGVGDFQKRMINYPNVFSKATGEKLVPGTLNVKVEKPIHVREHFRIIGAEIDEPEQDLLFEICRVDQIWAYRIRPSNVQTGIGGHGDDVIEITASKRIPDANIGEVVEISFFRDQLDG